jgi:AcrR family transcriptional regulator
VDSDGHTAVGLRERKRAATQTAIERAALALVLEHGYDNVTVDMVCEASMVCQRTFFNYFGSKEGVIVGNGPPEPSEAQVGTFVSRRGPGVLADVVELMTESLVDQESDMALFRARSEVLRKTPQLMDARLLKIAEHEDRLTQLVLARFAAEGRPGTDGRLEEEARMIVHLAGGVMRYIARTWSAEDTGQSARDSVRRAVDVLLRLSTNERPTGGRASDQMTTPAGDVP